jgi:hypothetical protein
MDQRTIQLLLKVLSSPATVLTESQMLAALELSGIVGNPMALKAMEFAAGQASATTPATLLGFATTLQNLIKLNPDHKPADYANLEAYIKQITTTGTDAPLTFGMFQNLMTSLPAAPLVPVRPKPPATPAAATKRRARKEPKKGE